MKWGILNCCLCFLVVVIMSPYVIKKLKQFKFGQNILVYVEKHKGKSGTPTMGGIVIVCACLIGYVLFVRQNRVLSTICVMSLVFFGVLGFLDDFIKIKFKHNEGLKPYQKIIGQLGISVIIAVFVYKSDLVGSSLVIPFTSKAISIGWGVIPFVIVFYLAVVNSVNLIDGLDGLCSGVSSVVVFVFSIVLILISDSADGVYFNEVNNIIIVSLGLVGSLLGFLCYNCFPAKVFLGDTGSLAIGGFVASMFVLTRQYLLICIIGFMFLLTTISVIMQVGCYKVSGKRIFKMSPLHHHFEHYMHESKVVVIYVIVSLIIGLLTISLYL